MTVKVVLQYKRDGQEDTSTGALFSDENTVICEEGTFEGLEFRDMLKQLCAVLAYWPLEQPVDVAIQRTDREGLVAYKLDEATVTLLRTDPVAAIQALEYQQGSPSTTVQRSVEARTPRPLPPVRVGHNTLADAFGENVYFKVRAHELECPGCGYWGLYVSPGLLKDPERAGSVFKTVFDCKKKCRSRFVVTCMTTWGYVHVDDLLKTALSAFYFPRAWNEGKSWVSREKLNVLYNQYKAEKEKVTCSETTK